MAKRYAFVTGVKHGSVDITTVRSVTYAEGNERIQRSGDADRYSTSQWKGVGDVTGTLEIDDPVQAQALIDAGEATLVFEGIPDTGTQNIKCTIVNVEFFSRSANTAHNAVAERTLNFGARSTDGQTSPVSEAVAAA